jgi:hypothetical protein
MLVFHHKPEVKWVPSVALRLRKFVRLNSSVKALRKGAALHLKFRVGVIHEAAVLFWGSPRIKNRQDITPTLNFRD